VQAEADELRAQNQQLNRQFAAASADVKSLKSQAAALSEAVQAEKFELMNAGQEGERLREQIVQSPEKFQRSLADLQARGPLPARGSWPGVKACVARHRRAAAGRGRGLGWDGHLRRRGRPGAPTNPQNRGQTSA
jgi:hypothetical protein